MSKLTVNAAAALLGVTPCRVRQMIETGKLRAFKFGSNWVIKSTDLAKLVRVGPGRPRKVTK